ncbi:YqiA/YcfP family alpha/beta fold hydrolase [Alteromonas confluentis]|uniref:Alpha/beta hydrolase n=1 Tax=Alteromonas confluentis TaxID=1656094 RepID=A0A1E7Z7W1_9ALTE|nr:YqiA/YcfP family alpha/beta fold hydrolase [Alteromonas confluentis]OFC69618.1 hypothetical protein BFC18_16205 [Alteromonas confluentis]
MHIIFSHGKESGPWGSKIRRLAAEAESAGHTVESLDYTDTLDPDQRVEQLLSHCENSAAPDLLVGSSMGGYVSLVAAEKLQPRGLFLMAPALFMPGYSRQSYLFSGNTSIVHGWNDEVIPFDNSVSFARSKLAALHLVNSDHGLASALDDVAALFAAYCASVESGS